MEVSQLSVLFRVFFPFLDTRIVCLFIFTQMEMQDFKEPILADLRNLQHEKAQLEKVRINSLYVYTVLCLYIQ